MVSKEVTLKLMDSAEILIRSFKADDLRRIYIYDGLQTIIDALPYSISNDWDIKGRRYCIFDLAYEVL